MCMVFPSKKFLLYARQFLIWMLYSFSRSTFIGYSLYNTPCIVFVFSFKLSMSISVHNIFEWNSPCYTSLAAMLKHPLSSLFPCHIIIPLLVFLGGLVSISFLHPGLAHPFPRLLVVLFLTRSWPPLPLNHLDMILLHVVLIFIPMVCTLFLILFLFYHD